MANHGFNAHRVQRPGIAADVPEVEGVTSLEADRCCVVPVMVAEDAEAPASAVGGYHATQAASRGKSLAQTATRPLASIRKL
jgi:hypothetical protein